MRYYFNLREVAEGGFIVDFPDIPEALTQGETREEAMGMAMHALLTAFEFYFEDRESIPLPSIITEIYVELPLSIEAKVLMLNYFIEENISQVDLANIMNVKKQEVTRLFDLRHSTKIDTIHKAINALGHRLEFKCV